MKTVLYQNCVQQEEKSKEHDSKVNYDNWIKPKSFMRITYFFPKKVKTKLSLRMVITNTMR